MREQPRLLYLHKSQVDTGTDDEHTVLVIEDITDERKLERQLLHNQRLASIAQLAAGVAHEIGNPVTGIACLAQNIKIETDQPELHDISSEILTQTERITEILDCLVNFAHVGSNDVRRATGPHRKTRHPMRLHPDRQLGSHRRPLQGNRRRPNNPRRPGRRNADPRS